MMTFRQEFMKWVYPIWLRINRDKKAGRNRSARIEPSVSVYKLQASTGAGELLEFSELKGKKLLLVNTASDCVYTPQYVELQQLSDQYPGSLQVIAFPSNEFKEQEKGADADIQQFCQRNFGVQFPIMQKSSVKKGPLQNPVYQWLTQSQLNGWNNKAPEWNFSKYLVDEKGWLTHYFGPAVSPMDETLLQALK